MERKGDALVTALPEGPDRLRSSIIVALDTDAHTALSLAHTLRGRVEHLKVGMTLFYAEGPGIVRQFTEMGFSVFVDLKLHDIPHQVRGAAREVARAGASMFTVHASGGRAMMEAAVRGACEGSAECGSDTPDVLAVTVLTSLDDAALAEVGVAASSAGQVELLTRLARESGVQGVICSPREASAARAILGPEALVVTPGVRPPWAATDDQARVATPADALAAGASHLVIGRPITGHSQPARAFERIVMEG
ncbi:MAG: orotidine-5'-phosphate decarboxylase [Anaerosomatales bacterium]|nr:orotidine-5'-phosphate decarboxylase [Anaerosomatales bacterium]MDT8433280.1 orotidine-5'-phosphate decarboxylase [Anaerosomatales bacterium]